MTSRLIELSHIHLLCILYVIIAILAWNLPAMAPSTNNKIVRDLLESYFSSMDVKSWTAHENAWGLNVTVRFSKGQNGELVADVDDSRKTFVKRSQKQMTRSKDRLGHFRSNYNTRSSKFKDNLCESENKRSESMDSIVTSQMLDSPVCVKSTPAGGASGPGELEDVPLIAVESPSFSDQVVSETPIVEAEAGESSIVSMPSLDSSSSSSESDMADTCDDESDLYSGSCSDNGCSYLTKHDPNDKFPYSKVSKYGGRVVCKRCDDSLVVCNKCLHKGKHRRHQNYFNRQCFDKELKVSLNDHE